VLKGFVANTIQRMVRPMAASRLGIGLMSNLEIQ
jgi:hypothetical protein